MKIEDVPKILKEIKKEKRWPWKEIVRELNSHGARLLPKHRRLFRQDTLSMIVNGKRPASKAQADRIENVFLK